MVRGAVSCGQSAVPELALWPRFAGVKYWNLKQERRGEDVGSGWVPVGPTILPTALWADCAVLIINYDSVFDTELFVMTLY